MENEVRNQTAPSPEGAGTKPECCCRKKLAAIVIAAVLLIVIIAAIACIFIFNAKAPALPKYAPEGTDVIAFVNGNKIAKTKVWAAFKKTRAYEEWAKEAKKEGFDPGKAEQSELCLFVDLSGKNPKYNIIARGKDAVAEKLFDTVSKHEKKSFDEKKKLLEAKNDPEAKTMKLSETKIDGKKAITNFERGESSAMILLDKDTIQFSVGNKDKESAALLKVNSIELSKAVDTKALVSIVYKFELPDSAKEMLKSDDSKLFKPLVDELKTVTLNLREADTDLELKLVADYGTADAAKKAYETLVTIRTGAKNGIEDKRIVEVIDSIKIEVNGKKVTATLKYPQSKLVEFIETWDKEQREEEKQCQEERKKIEAEGKKPQASENK